MIDLDADEETLVVLHSLVLGQLRLALLGLVVLHQVLPVQLVDGFHVVFNDLDLHGLDVDCGELVLVIELVLKDLRHSCLLSYLHFLQMPSVARVYSQLVELESSKDKLVVVLEYLVMVFVGGEIVDG